MSGSIWICINTHLIIEWWKGSFMEYCQLFSGMANVRFLTSPNLLVGGREVKKCNFQILTWTGYSEAYYCPSCEFLQRRSDTEHIFFVITGEKGKWCDKIDQSTWVCSLQLFSFSTWKWYFWHWSLEYLKKINWHPEKRY